MIFYSSFEYSYLWLPVIGFIIGFFASIMGSGGGFFFLPVLILLFKVPAQVAVATSLAATLPICLAGSVGHYRRGNVNLQIGLIFIISGIIGAITGAGLTNVMSSVQLKNGFGIYSILIAIPIFRNNQRRKKKSAKEETIQKKNNKSKIFTGSFFGLLSGIITGTFGTSGVAPVLAGLMSMDLSLKLVVGTSLLVVLVNTFTALGAHFVVGEIDLTLVFFLTSGSIIGALVGPKILANIKLGRGENRFRTWYALAMIIFGVILLAG